LCIELLLSGGMCVNNAEFVLMQGAHPGFAKGEGADHGERVEREPITGVWAQRGPGTEPLLGVGAKPPESESFSSIFIQKRGEK